MDKKLTVGDLRYERIDVVTGAVLTGVIGFFVVVACAAPLHVQGSTINDAADAAGALRPLAGNLAGSLFAVGLIGAALLAAAILPLSTAYSVCEYGGSEAALDDRVTDAKPFYITYAVVSGVAALIVLVPGAPLIPILVLSQVLNAVLLLPLLVFMYGTSRDRDLMDVFTASRPGSLNLVKLIPHDGHGPGEYRDDGLQTGHQLDSYLQNGAHHRFVHNRGPCGRRVTSGIRHALRASPTATTASAA